MFLALVLTFAAGAAAQPKKDLKKAKDLIDQADAFIAQKNYREAADRYGQAIVIAPVNSYAHFWKGYSHFSLNEPDQALSEFSLALSQGFKPFEIYRVRSYIYITQKKYDLALDDLGKALEIEPRNARLLHALGDVYVFKNQLKDALNTYQRASAIAPENGDIYYNIARVEQGLGDAKAQGTAAQEAISKGTQMMGEAYYLLGDASQKQKNIPAAIDAYQKAINVKPDSYVVYGNLADIYRSEGRFTDAINLSKQAIVRYPNDGGLYANISWYYSLADRSEDAIQAAKAGISLSPDNALAYTNLCRAYNDAKQYQLAIVACNNALRLSPKDGETNFYLGRSYDFLNKPKEATKYYERAVTGLVDFTNRTPEYSDGFYLLGNAYFSTNQSDNAIAAYNKCLALSPRFAKARFNLGTIYVLKGNKNAAMEQYSSLLKLDAALAEKLKAQIDKM